jgi:uncharacterized protein (TIGR02452 family)
MGLIVLPCLDSSEMARLRREELDIPRHIAAELGQSALRAADQGAYVTRDGREVVWRAPAEAARVAKRSIPPDASLPHRDDKVLPETRVQVTNESTLGAARRLTEHGLRPLALNFANGVHPGGGFLSGARAQEETLCRSSALFATLVDDPMYRNHRFRPHPDSTDWTIHSPDVPVFRTDDGMELAAPWPLSVLTCAAPYAPAIGQPQAGDLLQKRIHRVLAVARAFGYDTLVLGAWGCGAFKNDIVRTARDFRDALDTAYEGAFAEVVFAVTDWSPERKFLGPFRDVFASATTPSAESD